MVKIIRKNNDKKHYIYDIVYNYVMKRLFSRISFFVLTALLLGGFPSYMTQEAFAYTISSAVIDDPDNGNTTVDQDDTILIDFGLATNATAGGTMTKGEITANFTTSGNLFDGAITGSWETAGGANSNQFLKITLGTGAAGTVGDTITYALSATDGGIFNLAENDEADNTPITTTGNFGEIITATTTTSTSGGGSGCDDCEAPTLGIDKNGFRHVTNGFTYNGHSVDAERFFTPYPLITANVGKTNTADFKLYENEGISNIRHFTLAFGMDKGDIISDSKAKIELDIDYEGTETVTVTDPENALDNVQVTTSTVSCSDDSFAECLGISIQHRFRAPLDFNIVATDVWDSNRNSWQNYFNHGIEVVGESLNPPKEHDGIHKGYIYHLTETSKTTAVDEFGNTWSFNYGLWNMDYVMQEKVKDTSSIMTRTHSEFPEYKETQANKSIEQLLVLCPTCLASYTDFEDFTNIKYSERVSRENNLELQQNIVFESIKAQKILEQILDPYTHYQ